MLIAPLLVALLPSAAALQRGGRDIRQRFNMKLHRDPLPILDAPFLHPRSTNDTYRFRNNATEPFLVTSMPNVTWDFGEMYAGLVPLDPKNTSEALFFVFKPKQGDPVDELTIWLNGGPGCSSLEGWLQENGPILWQPATAVPVPNPYSWDKETNMIWVEQPVGTGFSIGTPSITSEEELAQQFLGFFKNFQTTFGISKFKIYVTGESYAGRYIPYISAAMVNSNNTEHFDLHGALMYDPCIGSYEAVAQEITAYPHVEKNRNIWGLNDTYMAQLKAAHEKCGYQQFIDQYLVFPPAGVQPAFNLSDDQSCDIFSNALGAAYDLNPCFNLYMVTDHCPAPMDPLASPAGVGVATPGTDIYFRRPDVIAALHAPTSVNWSDCSAHPVFAGGKDNSVDSIQHALPKVLEHTNRVLISNAEWDFVIITNGTLLSIQNMTWNGGLGFQSQPNQSFIVEEPDQVWAPLQGQVATDPQGVMGIKHYERGLMWVESFQSGHMQPQYQPRAGLLHLQWLLGRIDDL